MSMCGLAAVVWPVPVIVWSHRSLAGSAGSVQQFSRVRDVIFGPYVGHMWVRLALNGTNPGLFQIRFQYFFPNWTNLGLFQIRFQYILARCQISLHVGSVSQNALKSVRKKSRICPIKGQSDWLLAQIGHPYVWIISYYDGTLQTTVLCVAWLILWR